MHRGKEIVMTETDLQAALLETVGFETKTVVGAPKQIRLLGRVPQAGITAWLTMLESLLRVSEESKLWGFDASKQYFLRGNKLLYGWRLIFQGEKLTDALPSVVQLIRSARPSAAMMVEVPLHASPTRNMPKNGKGATATGYGRDSGPNRGGM